MYSQVKNICTIAGITKGLFFFGAIALVLRIEQASAEDRVVFRYVDDQGGGALIRDQEGRWLEFSGTKERFAFEELSRSDDKIELLDRSRDVALRIHSDFGELRMGGSSWRPWREGKWVEMSELPKEMRFIPTDNKIRLLYFVPSDRQPIANYEKKIRTVMEFVDEIYSRSLHKYGYEFEGLKFETDALGKPVIHLIRAKRPAQYYNNGPEFDLMKQFQLIYDDIPSEVGSVSRHTMMLLAETYDPGPAPKEWNGSVGAAVHGSGGGGVAMMSAWILKDEFCATSLAEQKKLILDDTPITGRRALGTRTPNSPRYEFIEDGFGAVAHELGHALSLAHDGRSRDNIMGNGFRHLQVNYLPSASSKSPVTFSRDNARMLRASPHLSFSNTNQVDTPPKADVTSTKKVDAHPQADVTASWDSEGAPTIDVTLKASDERGLRAVVFFSPQFDSVIGGSELNGAETELKINLPVNRKVGDFLLVTTLVDTGGNFTKVTTKVTP